MDTVFLPGNIRQRLLDLMKHNNVSQTELARKIGCNDSLLSRFLSEKTDKLGDENIPCSMLYVELPHDETMTVAF